MDQTLIRGTLKINMINKKSKVFFSQYVLGIDHVFESVWEYAHIIYTELKTSRYIGESREKSTIFF